MLQPVVQTALIEPHDYLATRFGLDHRRGGRLSPELLEFRHPSGILADVAVLKRDALLGKPRFLRMTGTSAGLRVHDNLYHQLTPPAVYCTDPTASVK